MWSGHCFKQGPGRGAHIIVSEPAGNGYQGAAKVERGRDGRHKRTTIGGGKPSKCGATRWSFVSEFDFEVGNTVDGKGKGTRPRRVPLMVFIGGNHMMDVASPRTPCAHGAASRSSAGTGRPLTAGFSVNGRRHENTVFRIDSGNVGLYDDCQA